jgi:hypothetical protein
VVMLANTVINPVAVVVVVRNTLVANVAMTARWFACNLTLRAKIVWV